MICTRLIQFSAIAALSLTACERKTVVIQPAPATPVEVREPKTKTLETTRLGEAVDLYQREPTSANAAAVKRAVADLDGEIAELDERVAKTSGADREEAFVKAQNLKSYRASETARFSAAQVKAGVTTEPAARDARTGVEKVEDTAQRVGNSIERAGRQVGDAVKDAVR